MTKIKEDGSGANLLNRRVFKIHNPLLKELLDAPGCAAHKEYAKQIYDPAPQPDIVQFVGEVFEDWIASAARMPSDAPWFKEAAAGLMFEMAPLVVGSEEWRRTGFPVINLTEDFFHSVAVTDFGDGDDAPLNLPFPALCLRFPENQVLDGARSVFLYPLWCCSARIGDGNDGHYVAIELPTKTRATLGVSASGRHFTQWDNGIPLGQFVRAPARQGAINIAPPENPERAGEILAVLRRIIGNTLLYIENHGGLPTTKKLGADVPVEREHAVEPRFRVGRPIRLAPQLRTALKSQRGSNTWKLAVRFMVREHWRNQPHGEGRKERKRIWIQPFWKGPETVTEALERTYSVE